MDKRNLTLVLGLFVAGLGVLGLVSGEGRLGDALNIDMLLDVARIALGGWVAYSSRADRETMNTALNVLGGSYLAMLALGMISGDLFGLVPSGLGWMDHVVHLVGGIASLGLANLSSERRSDRAEIA